MEVEPSSQLLPAGSLFASPGGKFAYEVQGPCSRLYDREELPWPSCSLQWKGKQPSWNRVGKRFVPDMACSRCPSYAVKAVDGLGSQWRDVVTLYWEPLSPELKQWWYTKKPERSEFPPVPQGAQSLELPEN